MRLDSHPDFESSLLDLLTAIHPLVDRQHPSERATAVIEARQRFLAAVAPLRLKVLIAEASLTLKAVDDNLALVAKAIDIARAGGASCSDLAALFNRKVGGGAEE